MKKIISAVSLLDNFGAKGMAMLIFLFFLPAQQALAFDDVIEVTEPSATSNWRKGRECTIRWEKGPGCPVKIRLYKGHSASYYYNITDYTTNQSSYDWTVPEHLPVDTDYEIKITTVCDDSPNEFDYSEYFEISGPPPEASFNASPTSGNAPLTVSFTDQSTGSPVDWSWDFGDGGSSSNTNPSHTYYSAGKYSATLTVSNTSGSTEHSVYITVNEPPPLPEASFVASPTLGDAPLTVNFTDRSRNNPSSWSWDFGDGSTPATAENPTHTYESAGTYTVSLTVSNANGSDTKTQTNYIVVTQPEPQVLSVTPSFREVPATNDTTSFEVSNTGAGIIKWAAVSNASWLTIIKESDQGANSGTIIVSHEANAATTERTGTITVTASGATGSPQTVEVRQAGAEIPILSVSPLSSEVHGTGGTAEFQVSNAGDGIMKWTAASNASWITIIKGSDQGVDSGTILVSYEESTSDAERTGTITVTATDAAESPQIIEVSQASGETQILSVTPSSSEVSATSGTTSFEVSNAGGGTMEWTAISNASWLTIIKGTDQGTDDGMIIVSYEENSADAERTGTITVTAAGATDSPQTLEVRQSATETQMLSVAPSSTEIPGTGGTVSFKVINAGEDSVEWTAVSDASWLTIIKNTDQGIDSGVVIVAYEKNADGERTGRITITATTEPDSPLTVIVTQSPHTEPDPLEDAIRCLQIVSGITPLSDDQSIADVNEDDKIGLEEAIHALRKAAGLSQQPDEDETPSPVADFTVSNPYLCAGSSVTFTDSSSNSPTTWSWSFPGATPASSDEMNPTMFYDTPGVYDVTLTVENADGTSTETKPAYISVIQSSGDKDSGDVEWLWAEKIGGDGYEYTNATTTDADGNAYFTGEFSGSASFDGTTLTNNGMNDIFLVKYDTDGNVAWAVSAGGGDKDVGYGIATDDHSNVYLCGRFKEPASFGNVTLSDNTSYNVLVSKYDAGGNLVWAKGFESYNAYCMGIDTDAEGNVYIAGYFHDALSFGGTTLISDDSVSYNYMDVFIAKFNTNGNPLWARKAGDWDQDKSYAMAVDPDGNSYITGQFCSTITFGITTLAEENYKMFVAKHDTNGNPVWAKSVGGNCNSAGNGISLDADANAYITGRVEGTAIFGSHTFTTDGVGAFLIKYDSSGNVEWVKNNGGGGISVNADGGVYVAGGFASPATFEDTTLTIDGDYGVFVAKYDALGNLIHVTGAEARPGAGGYDISADADGNVHISGSFAGTATFGETSLTADGVGDIFMAKLGSVFSCPSIRPTITLSDPSATFCGGGTLTASPGYPNYIWSTGETTPSITVTQSGDFFVEVSDCDGCSGKSGTVSITVAECEASEGY